MLHWYTNFKLNNCAICMCASVQLFSNSVQLYESKIQMRFKSQSRQLRASHPDQQYCVTIFKYLREREREGGVLTNKHFQTGSTATQTIWKLVSSVKLTLAQKKGSTQNKTFQKWRNTKNSSRTTLLIVITFFRFPSVPIKHFFLIGIHSM